MIRFVFWRSIVAAIWRMEWRGERVNAGSGGEGRWSGKGKILRQSKERQQLLGLQGGWQEQRKPEEAERCSGAGIDKLRDEYGKGGEGQGGVKGRSQVLACTTEWMPIPSPTEGTVGKERLCHYVSVPTVSSAYKACQPLANSFFKLPSQHVSGSSCTFPIPVLKSAIFSKET